MQHGQTRTQTIGISLKTIYTKATVRKNTMRQDNFGKCSRCHHFSEIFQYVINRRKNANWEHGGRNGLKNTPFL